MITLESLKSYQDSPEPLILLCLKQIIKWPSNLCRCMLPSELGDLVAVAFRDHALANRSSSLECDYFFEHFRHKFVPLSRINFSNLPITEEFFIAFLQEYRDHLDEINISNCPGLSRMNLRKFNQLLKSDNGVTKTHKTLIIGTTFSTMLESRKRISSTGSSSPPSSSSSSSSLCLMTSSPSLNSSGTTAHPTNFEREHLFDHDLKLKKLVLHKVYPRTDTDEFSINRRLSEFLTPTMSHSLKYLDLSMCLIGKGSALMQLESLEILILYSCSMTYPDIISTICQLKDLRVLDLSRQASDSEGVRADSGEDPKLLDLLVSRLPKLTRLDLSGTDLVGGKDRNISAFESRMDRPFEFLGLFHTGNDAAYRSCIPALTIAGEANESQLLNACEAYIDRPGQLSKALDELYKFYKTITPSETFDDVNRALDVVLPILTKHIDDETVIIFTTAALWCIVKINVTAKNLNDARVRRTVTSRLLDVMHCHKTCRVILINGGLTLLFLPDIICEHSRVAAISLLMCRDTDPRTQGFGTTLLNTLACQVGGDQKIFIGQLNAIETMIDIIKSKIKENNCDEILEAAWSTLWNITDETPANCQRFLDFRGLDAFESCMDKFDNNKEVLRNIMGLLGNVAECPGLRAKFMQAKYINRFCALLSSPVDGIECSYNACGILAHLVSDGQGFWDTHLERKISRQYLLASMRSAISSWPVNSKRNINYRSFEPIVRLLDEHVAAEAQYWAAFALTNLTRINPAKYCPMLIPHDGLTRLRRLTQPGVTKPFVRNLAQITIYQYERFENEDTLAGLEKCNSVDIEVVMNFRAEPNQGDGTSEVGELLM